VSNADPEMIPHGIVVGLAQTSFLSDPEGLQPKPSTDLFIDESQEQLLVDQGFLALSRCPGGPFSAFYAAPSLQVSKIFDRRQATENAKLSSTLDAMLCVSRFAHYLKVLGRSWLGTFASADDIERTVHNWLMQHVGNSSSDISAENRAIWPLTEAAVKVVEDPGATGAFKCQIHLRPRLNPDGLVTSIRLMTDLVSPNSESSEL
jgi:type VI secretion system ImpC/EvpB family protein